MREAVIRATRRLPLDGPLRARLGAVARDPGTYADLRWMVLHYCYGWLGLLRRRPAVLPLICRLADTARALLDDAQRQAEEALTELRHVVRGIHPPILSDRGLPGAVRALAVGSGLRVTVDAGQLDDSPRAPAAVEAAPTSSWPRRWPMRPGAPGPTGPT